MTLVYNKGATALGGLKDMARQLRRLPTVDLELPTVSTSVRDSTAARVSFFTLHAGLQPSQILILNAVVVFEASGVTQFTVSRRPVLENTFLNADPKFSRLRERISSLR